VKEINVFQVKRVRREVLINTPLHKDVTTTDFSSSTEFSNMKNRYAKNHLAAKNYQAEIIFEFKDKHC